MSRWPATGAHHWSTDDDAGDVSSLRARAEAAGWSLAHLDGAQVRSAGELHDALAASLGFPDHYGRNLDALRDSLRDVAPRTVLLWDDWGALALAEPRTFRVALDLLAVRLLVLLRGPGPGTGLTEITGTLDLPGTDAP